MIRLSERLQTAASLVANGAVLADVGTDHGYVPIYLIQKHRIPSAIALDINVGPLERAREHIALHQLENKIETRLSDGVAALWAGEADAILIAGMGGGLIIHILTDGAAVCKAAKELILQPQSELPRVREFLETEGYVTMQEEMVLEDGKFYPMMRVQNTAVTCEDMIQNRVGQSGQNATVKRELAWQYGGLLLEQRHPVLLAYLQKEEAIYRKIYSNLKKSPMTEKNRERLREVEQILQYNQEAMKYYHM
jgi:tRNA (adenine22-N1)-methyltransferase